MFSTLKFSELYLGSKHFYISGAGRDGLRTLDEAYNESAIQLRGKCQEEHDSHRRDEFSICDSSITYRVSKLQSIADTVFVLRKFQDKVPILSDYNLHPKIYKNIMTPHLQGILLVCGAYSSGKTTTASAIIQERLNQIGGVCVTVEDPPEMPLDKEYEKGVCYQSWAVDGDFEPYIKKTARFAPSILFIGEIRDSKAAQEAIKAALNGILVIASFHASDIMDGLQRLHALASHNNSNSDEVADLIASGLAGVFHQKLVGDEGNKRLEIQSLWLHNDDNRLESVNHIKSRNWSKLIGPISYQRNMLINEE